MNSEQFQKLWLCFANEVKNNKDELNSLDSAIGDADHGTNLDRGLQKVVLQSATSSLQKDCKTIAMVLLSNVGGASGALWGSALLACSRVLPDSDNCQDSTFIEFLKIFGETISQRGKSSRGDKTMLDVFIPAFDQISKDVNNGISFNVAVSNVGKNLESWTEETKPLQAKKGRAAYLGPRSIGHIDPGARSCAMWWHCLDRVSNS